MGRFLLAALVLVSCGGVPGRAQVTEADVAAQRVEPEVVDPESLVAHTSRLSAIVLRNDGVAAKLMRGTEFTTPNVTAPSQPKTLWVVAVVGLIRPEFGGGIVRDRPCGLFAFDARSGDVWGMRAGPLSDCQPYFDRSLTHPRLE